MGVNNLWDLLQLYGHAVEHSALRGKVLAVDASIWIYQFLSVTEEDEESTDAHIIGFFFRICKLFALGIRPLFIFDGPPPVLKKEALELRRTLRESESSPENIAKKIFERRLRDIRRNKSLDITNDTYKEIEKPECILSTTQGEINPEIYISSRPQDRYWDYYGKVTDNSDDTLGAAMRDLLNQPFSDSAREQLAALGNRLSKQSVSQACTQNLSELLQKLPSSNLVDLESKELQKPIEENSIICNESDNRMLIYINT